MAKKALLVSFSPLTRIVVDVEDLDNLTPEEQSMIVRIARKKMLVAINDYLYGENVDMLEEDTEIPYQEGEELDEDEN